MELQIENDCGKDLQLETLDELVELFCCLGYLEEAKKGVEQ